MRMDTNKPAHQVGYAPACAAHRFAASGLLRLLSWFFACNNYIINACDRSSIVAAYKKRNAPSGAFSVVGPHSGGERNRETVSMVICPQRGTRHRHCFIKG